jgi:hypothetical protein
MAYVWGLFAISVLLTILAARNIWRRATSRPVVNEAGTNAPWQLDAGYLFLGLVGTISSVPGLLFGQPTWLIDHVWGAIARATGNAV